MIGRYTRPEMGRIWELENKFAIWKEIEVLACEAQAELGQAGITREEAYKIVQDDAMATWHEVQDCTPGTSFKDKLAADSRCTLTAQQLDAIFDPQSFLVRKDVVFDRLEKLEFE